MYNIDQSARGTRIVAGEEARRRRETLNQLIAIANKAGFEEVILPSIEPQSVYVDKAGAEILGQMYAFSDKKGRDLCLRPEGTATIQLIANKYYSRGQEARFWYFERCWRYEKPQRGRYREFFQFGMEVINPKAGAVDMLLSLAQTMVSTKTIDFEVDTNAVRGLSYYTGEGFEISSRQLGAQSQIVGGGEYQQGVGFAVGFDRLMLCN